MDNPNSPIKCRPAQQEDVDFIHECLLHLVQEQGTADRYSQTPDSLFYALFSKEAFAECVVAEVNETNIGILLYSVSNMNFTIFPSPGIYVHDIYVKPAFRRRGVASLLGDHVKNIAIDHKYSRIDGIILKDNESAMAFYHKVEDINVLDYIHYMRLKLY
ncbi:MAG: N-acetyltransferase family protein [Candidatus Berkiella sp.]